MKFNEIAMLAEGIDDFTPYGGTPLGVLAMKKGVIDTKDSYARRERLVREWANEKWGTYATGLFRALNRQRPLKGNRDFERGYNHGRKLRGS